MGPAECLREEREDRSREGEENVQTLFQSWLPFITKSMYLFIGLIFVFYNVHLHNPVVSMLPLAYK